MSLTRAFGQAFDALVVHAGKWGSRAAVPPGATPLFARGSAKRKRGDV